tara:strand:+ start:156 stop:821 length:666 start_codon:yes stop_codon:yes gene_type:complete
MADDPKKPAPSPWDFGFQDTRQAAAEALGERLESGEGKPLADWRKRDIRLPRPTAGDYVKALEKEVASIEAHLSALPTQGEEETRARLEDRLREAQNLQKQAERRHESRVEYAFFPYQDPETGEIRRRRGPSPKIWTDHLKEVEPSGQTGPYAPPGKEAEWRGLDAIMALTRALDASADSPGSVEYKRATHRLTRAMDDFEKNQRAAKRAKRREELPEVEE